ncbi:MAG TPA: RHS repeat-associated core domain-containing protein [Acidimicrobiales bacterium]|nr:RHS repeat-associated core domain-containing protein [Acidimicrobiales bacterium]
MTKNSRLLTSTGQIRSTIYTYGDAGHPGDVTAITDPNAKVWAVTYNANGDLASETDPLGNKTTHGYDSIGRRTSTVSAKGNATGANPATYTSTFTYNAFGQLLVSTDPLGHQVKRTYDADQNLASLTDELNKATTYGYDAANQLTVMTRADNTTLQNSYDLAGNLATQKDGKSNLTTYTYDPLNRVSSVKDPLNRTTTYNHDRADNLTSVVDALNQTTTLSYDAANQLTSKLYSDPATLDVTSLGYDANGQRTSMVDGTGTSIFEWDSLNRLTRSSNGAGVTVRYGYDLKGQTTSLTYPNSQVVTRTYDGAGRMATVKDWLNHTTIFSYDANDSLDNQTYPNGTQAAMGYDAADQLLSIADTKAATTLASFSYGRDNAGQLASASSTGMAQPAESYGYTSLNQLASVNSTSYSYDAADNLTRLTSGATLGHDDANQATSHTQAGVVSSLSYDAKGNRTLASGPAPPARYRYDQANRLTEVATFTGLVAAGESHSLALGSDGVVRAWGANTLGQLGNGLIGVPATTPAPVVNLSGASAVGAGVDHSLALKSNGTVWAWGDNSNGQIGSGAVPNPATSPVQVPGLTEVTSVAGGGFHSLALKSDGSVTAWGSNITGQLGNSTTSVVPSGPVQATGLSGVSAVAAGRDHSLGLKSDGTVWAWGFNGSGQLGNNSTTSSSVPLQVTGLSGVTAIAGGGDHSLALKSDGTVWAWGANDSGQLGTASTIDSLVPVQVSGLAGAVAVAAGSTHSLAARADGTGWAWGANGSGQLGNASTTTSLVPVQASGLGSAVAVAAGSTHSLALRSDATVRAWGANTFGQLGNGSTANSSVPVSVTSLSNVQPVAKATYAYNGDGLRISKSVARLTTAFAWDLSGGLPMMLKENSTYYVYGPGGTPLERIDSSGAVTYHHQDQLGSTSLLTDAAGAVVATASYDAYGKTTSSTGSARTPLGYAGQYTDAETGFQYLRARYYDPAMGTFLTRDPIEAVTQEAYGYVGGDPLNATDPTGLYAMTNSERRFCRESTKNAARCLVAFRLSRLAIRDTTARYGHKNDDTSANAFQHCYWNALMTMHMGARAAKGFGDRHEQRPRGRKESGETYDARKRMDLANNRLGRKIGGCSESATACYENPNLVVLK